MHNSNNGFLLQLHIQSVGMESSNKPNICIPCTPPFFAVNKHRQNNRLTDQPQVSASMI